MTTVKTAISLHPSLFEQADTLAREMNVPRSRLFALAIEEFIRRHNNQELLAQINAAVGDEQDPDENIRLQAMRRSHRRMVEGEW